jgi:molybdopterin-binding protein
MAGSRRPARSAAVFLRRARFGKEWGMDRDEHTVEAIAQHLHGVRYRQEGRWADALAAQRRALALRPDLAEAHYEVGVLNLELQKHDEALAAFRSAIEHDPESAEAQYGLGCAYRHLSQYDRAIAACSEALRLRPAYVLAWEETGVTYGLMQEYPRAVQAFQEALRLEPQNARVRCALGHAYVMIGDLSAAAEEQRVLEELDQQMADLLRTLLANVTPFSVRSRMKEAPMAAARFISISGRNQLKGTIEDVQVEGLLAQVRLRVGEETLTAVITRDAVQDLQLKRGDRATAVIKATEVMIAKEAD